MILQHQMLPTPSEMVAFLDQFIFGQERAKRDLSVCLYRHYLGLAHQAAHSSSRSPFGKNHILLVGPTGCGKTLIVRKLAEFLNVPIVFATATRLVETGYVGEHVEDLVSHLFLRAR